MNFETVKSKIEEWLAPVLQEKNLFLVDIKFSQGKRIEVYADSDEGIHISECAELSRFIEKNLDGSGLVPDNYILEVSSPGMSNPLRVPRQYKRRIGRVLEVVKTDGTTIEAELTEVTEDGIKLQQLAETKSKTQKAKEKKAAGGKQITAETVQEWQIGFSEIKKATLQFKT